MTKKLCNEITIRFFQCDHCGARSTGSRLPPTWLCAHDFHGDIHACWREKCQQSVRKFAGEFGLTIVAKEKP